MAKFYYSLLYALLLVLVVSAKVSAQESESKSIKVTQIFEQLANIPEVSARIKKSPNSTEYLNELKIAFDNSTLSESIRLQLYKDLLNATDVRVWPAELKALALNALMQYDANNAVHAYKIAEKGRTAFFEIINNRFKEDFAFVEEWKKKAIEEMGETTYEAQDIELTDEQRQAAIGVAYENLIQKGVDVSAYKF